MTDYKQLLNFNVLLLIRHKKSAAFLVACTRKPDQRPTPKAKGMPTPKNVGISTLLSLGVEKLVVFPCGGKYKAKRYF
jgi:hypothetical protein